jgi:hypothetical protein
MLFRIWRLNHTHEHSDVHVLTTIAPRSFIHYHRHYANSAIDSVVQQLTKYIHSYFAVLFAEVTAHDQRSPGVGLRQQYSYCEPNLVEGCSWKDTSEASQLAGQLQQPGNERDMRHSSALRGGAPHEAGRGLPQTYRTVVTICTTSLTFTNPTFCPQIVFMCFVWISEQRLFLYTALTDWLL